MCSHIFAPASIESVRHTAISRLLATDPDFLAAVGLESAELAPPSSYILDALERWGPSSEPTETAHNLCNATPLPMFGFLAQNPERARRFGAGMRFLTRGSSYDLRHLLSGFDWAGLER